MNARNNSLYMKICFNDLKELFRSLYGSISYAVLKGEVLSYYAYNSFGKRNSNDIDILIPKYHINYLVNLFKENGYIRKYVNRSTTLFYVFCTHQCIPFYKKSKLAWINIDLNFDIFWGEYQGKRVDMEEFLSDTVEMNIYGITVKTLPPLKTLIQLILHHYKDMNSLFLLSTRKSIHYNMFKDVYYLFKNNLDAIPLDKLYEMSLQYEIIPHVYYVLYHTGLLFEDEVLQRYIAAFKTDEGETLINCYGLTESERKEWKYDFETRLKANNLYELIKTDLTEKDKQKIEINKQFFLGEKK